MSMRHRAGEARRTIRGEIDARRLRRRYPWFPSDTSIADAAETLRPGYQEYVTTVSPASMTASLETCALLMALSRARASSTSADLGSGFSSYALRVAAQEHGGSATSVDDDNAWLEKTAEFLIEHNVEADHLIMSESLAPEERVDLVFHDLANGETRERSMRTAVSALSPDGVIVFDDMQHRGHRAAAGQAAREYGLTLYSLRSLTLDSIGRFAMLGVGPGRMQSRGVAVPIRSG